MNEEYLDPLDKCECNHMRLIHSASQGCKSINGTSTNPAYVDYCNCQQFNLKKRASLSDHFSPFSDTVGTHHIKNTITRILQRLNHKNTCNGQYHWREIKRVIEEEVGSKLIEVNDGVTTKT